MTAGFQLPWHKRIFKSPQFQNAVTALVAWLMRAMWLTFRVTHQIDPAAMPYSSGEKHGVFCFWHGRMILLPFFMPKGRAMHVLISQHRDGELIAKFIRNFGIDSIRGSSSRGAREAWLELLNKLAVGDNISITPDGPRGPAQVASRGAAHIAKKSGCPMIPVTFAASHAWRLKSWDRLVIPRPFSRVVMIVGAPITIEATANLSNMQQGQQALQNALNSLTEQADRQVMPV